LFDDYVGMGGDFFFGMPSRGLATFCSSQVTSRVWDVQM
jgi:hypothetical protein